MYRVLISGIIISMHLLSGATAVFSQDYNIRYNIIDSLITVREYRQSFTSCTLAINSLPAEEQVTFQLKAAQILCYLHEKDQAKRYLEKIRKIPTDLFKAGDKALQWHVEGLYLMEIDEDSLAEVNFTRAEEELEHCCEDQTDLLGDLYLDWTRLHEKFGDIDSAIKKAEKALQYNERKKNELKTVRDLIRIADLQMYCIGDVELAFDYISQAEQTWIRDSLFPLKLWILGQKYLAAIYNARDEWQKTNEVYENCLRRIKNSNSEQAVDIPYFLLSIGTNYLETADTAAYTYLRKTVQNQLSLPVSQRTYIDNAYEKLGVYFYKQGQLDSSLLYLYHAINNFRANEDPQLPIAYQELAETYLVAGDHEKALWAINSSLRETGYEDVLEKDPKNLRDENVDVFFNPLELKGRVYLDLYQKKGYTSDLDSAMKVYEWIEGLAEKSRSGSYSEETKLTVSEHFYRAAGTALQVLQALYSQTPDPAHVNQAFEFMEHNRYASLFRNMARIRAMSEHKIPERIDQRENAFRAKVEELRHQIESDSMARAILTDSLLRMQRGYQEFKDSISLQFPLYYDVEYDSLFSLDQIRINLPDESQLIEYFWTDKTIHILSLSRDTVQFVSIPNQIYPVLEQLLRWLADPHPDQNSLNYRQFSILSFYLWQELLQPFMDRNNTKIIVSPDGPLAYLPFEILISDTLATNFRNADYLIKYHDFQYTYSSNLLFTASSQPLSEKPEILAMAFSEKTSHKGSLTTDGANEIMYSEHEVDGIRRQFPRSSVELLKGSKASKSNFIKQTSNCNMLHLAIHGMADAESTIGSYLLFNDQQDTLDGRLHAYELYNLNLNKLRLVVLSACESGVGKASAGEGIFSIARGFSRNNNTGLVMSLWKADDRVTAGIMKSFYRELSKGLTTSQSIRKAKIEYLKGSQENLAIPHYWATFIPLGPDFSIVTTNSGSNRYFLLILLAVLFACFIIILYPFKNS